MGNWDTSRQLGYMLVSWPHPVPWLDLELGEEIEILKKAALTPLRTYLQALCCSTLISGIPLVFVLHVQLKVITVTRADYSR